jgi:hypothetical protein
VLLGVLSSFGFAACTSEELPREATTTAGVPLPECPSIATTPCNTLEATCQDKLLSLAVCMYGVDNRPNVPIRVVPEEELIDELQGRINGANPADDPRQVHFERAMSELLLMQPNQLTGEGGTAEDFVDRIDGYYLNPHDGITLVDRGMPRDNADANAVLLHELVHAVQDAEYDFATWDAAAGPDYDTKLARLSVPEGQATMYQYRAQIAMMGRDPAKIDWEISFDELRDRIVGYAHKDKSPYFAARTTFPYAHGALLAYRAWQSNGPRYHTAQFGEPPERTLDVMLASYEKPEVTVKPRLVEPPLPAPYVSVDHGVLGAFMVELFAHQAGANSNAAQALGLAWRADSIWICRNGDDTGYLWEIAFDSPESANDFQALSALPENVALEAQGERVFLAGSGTPPDFFLETGRKFLAAAQSGP